MGPLSVVIYKEKQRRDIDTAEESVSSYQSHDPVLKEMTQAKQRRGNLAQLQPSYFTLEIRNGREFLHIHPYTLAYF